MPHTPIIESNTPIIESNPIMRYSCLGHTGFVDDFTSGRSYCVSCYQFC